MTFFYCLFSFLAGIGFTLFIIWVPRWVDSLEREVELPKEDKGLSKREINKTVQFINPVTTEQKYKQSNTVDEFLS